MIPIFVNLEKFKVCIFGFGDVGKRRFNKLLNANPYKITIYSKDIDQEEINKYENNYRNVEFITCDINNLSNDDLKNIIQKYDFIISAIDEKNNKRIVHISKKLNKFISSSTFEKNINLIIPAYCNVDDIYFTVYTQGKSPLIAKNIRKLVENYLKNHEYDIDAQNSIRDFLKNNISSQKDRKRILEKIFKNKDFKREFLELVDKYK
ncbi:precorrin-2 dehydrogenase/sirohydrochlorin ferrochelatase family protein [Methanothermococcus okinawensis]|nr:NAD(P)-dependent oxidoreductase [Methanothermococcus okinawensis]